MNLAKQFREFGVLNSINPLPPDAQVFYYNLLQSFNTARWIKKLIVRTQTLEIQCGMTRKRLAVCRNTLIQRGLIKYYPAKQASGSPTYEMVALYEDSEGEKNGYGSIPVFPTETHRGTQEGTHRGTQEGTHVFPTETPSKTVLKLNKTKTETSCGDETPGKAQQENSKPKDPEEEEKEKKPPARKKEKEATPHWQKLVDVWFCFYRGKTSLKPTFDGPAQKSLQSIATRLEDISVEKGFEWNLDHAEDCFLQFLTKAYDFDEWLRTNFMLPNLSSKFDAIINPNNNGNSKANGRTANGAKSTSEQLNTSFAKFHNQS